jgi:hypothetical protein
LDNEHRLYLFGGQSFILVPESTWLNALKSDSTGVAIRKSIEDALVIKGWVKTKETVDPDTHEATVEWLYQETGAKIKTVVDKNGQLKVNGTAIGSATVGETYGKLKKMVEDSNLTKWAPASAEVTPEEKAAFNKPKNAVKGGPHPIADIMTSNQALIANQQLIGKYVPLIAKENLTPDQRMQKVHRIMELAEKEENENEREKLMQVVDRELDLIESAQT